MFETFRAKELAEVGVISPYGYKLKVVGDKPGEESKWLRISASELEKIIAALEPEDYKQAMEDLQK